MTVVSPGPSGLEIGITACWQNSQPLGLSLEKHSVVGILTQSGDAGQVTVVPILMTRLPFRACNSFVTQLCTAQPCQGHSQLYTETDFICVHGNIQQTLLQSDALKGDFSHLYFLNFFNKYRQSMNNNTNNKKEHNEKKILHKNSTESSRFLPCPIK